MQHEGINDGVDDRIRLSGLENSTIYIYVYISKFLTMQANKERFNSYKLNIYNPND